MRARPFRLVSRTLPDSNVPDSNVGMKGALDACFIPTFGEMSGWMRR